MYLGFGRDNARNEESVLARNGSGMVDKKQSSSGTHLHSHIIRKEL